MKSKKVDFEPFYSAIIFLFGILLFYLISIETFLFGLLSKYDLLNTNTELYLTLKEIPHSLNYFPYIFLIMFYFTRLQESLVFWGRWQDIFSLSLSYNYGSIFGSRLFRRIMRIFLFLHLAEFMDLYSHAGALSVCNAIHLIHPHSILFCIIMILISRLIEWDHYYIETESTHSK